MSAAVATLTEGVAHPLIILDAAGHVLAANRMACQMLHLRDLALGRNISDLIHGVSKEVLLGEGMHTCQVAGTEGLPQGRDALVCVTRRVDGHVCINLMEGVPADVPLAAAGQREETADDAVEVSAPDGGADLGEDQLPSPLAMGKPGLHVLLVEDDDFQANVMQSMCEMNGYAIEVCDNGPEALRKIFAPASRYNLVLLDLVMRPMHGLDILKEIRKRSQDITVVIISNSDERHMVKACIHHGANSYIVKPVRERDLSNIGQFVLQHRYQSLKLQHMRLNQAQLQQWSMHQLERQRLEADKEKAEAWAVAAKEAAERQLLEREKREQQTLLQAAQDRAAREAARKEAAMEKERADMQKQIMHMIYRESQKYMDLAKFYNDILVHVSQAQLFVHMSADAKTRLGHEPMTTDSEVQATILAEDAEMLAGLVDYCISKRDPAASPSEPAEHFDLSFRCACATGRLAAINVHFYPIVDSRGQIRTVIGAVPRHHARRAISRKNVSADALCETIRSFYKAPEASAQPEAAAGDARRARTSGPEAGAPAADSPPLMSLQEAWEAGSELGSGDEGSTIQTGDAKEAKRSQEHLALSRLLANAFSPVDAAADSPEDQPPFAHAPSAGDDGDCATTVSAPAGCAGAFRAAAGGAEGLPPGSQLGGASGSPSAGASRPQPQCSLGGSGSAGSTPGGISAESISAVAVTPSLSTVLKRQGAAALAACKEGDRRLAVIREYMVESDENKYTPLGRAALAPDGAEAALRQVFADVERLGGAEGVASVDVNQGSLTGGWTPLCLALVRGDANVGAVRVLLDRGADVEACPQALQPCTPFLLAVSTCQVKLTELFLERKANVNAQDKNGNTALHLCAEWEHRQLALGLTSSLIRAGARLDVCNRDDLTPQAFASKLGFRELASLMHHLSSPSWSHAREMLLDSMEQEFGLVNGPSSKNSSRNSKKGKQTAQGGGSALPPSGATSGPSDSSDKRAQDKQPASAASSSGAFGHSSSPHHQYHQRGQPPAGLGSSRPPSVSAQPFVPAGLGVQMGQAAGLPAMPHAFLHAPPLPRGSGHGAGAHQHMPAVAGHAQQVLLHQAAQAQAAQAQAAQAHLVANYAAQQRAGAIAPVHHHHHMAAAMHAAAASQQDHAGTAAGVQSAALQNQSMSLFASPFPQPQQASAGHLHQARVSPLAGHQPQGNAPPPPQHQHRLWHF
mmetsp:Transcript_12197/g.32740  ORF Transcript_12197/g.32740 Transcript_12197/m.32740 type:complete len:1201 (+) Transcript_12197:51-3653(+)